MRGLKTFDRIVYLGFNIKTTEAPVVSELCESACACIAQSSAGYFKILIKSTSDMNLLTHEALLIGEMRPSLNENFDQLNLILFN